VSPQAPVLVAETELAEKLGELPTRPPAGRRPYVGVHLLVRFGSEPLGVLELPMPLDRRQLADVVWETYGEAVRSRLVAAGFTAPPTLPARGLGLPEEQRRSLTWLRGRAEALASAPPFSVVICTRDPGEDLEVTLSAAASLEYPNYEIVLVDNASETDTARRLVEGRVWGVPLRLVAEPRPGLSRARNAGARAAEGDLVAFLDDDETPDAHWLAEYARAFHEVPDASAASGLILPRSLDTDAQVFFESLGGHSKGRGFEQGVFDQASHVSQHPLYPMPPFGAGGNMCFRSDVLRSIGYFDEALGAGTRARGAEDTAAFADTMLAGFTTVWQPSAFVRHDHYESIGGAVNQLRGYGVGLTAFYTRMLVADPRRAWPMLRLLRRAVGDLRRPGTTLIGAQDGPARADLRRAQLTGLAVGPLAYLASRRALRGGEQGTT
jgi:glycosyltransferase involved in cell wall biosynthesis